MAAGIAWPRPVFWIDTTCHAGPARTKTAVATPGRLRSMPLSVQLKRAQAMSPLPPVTTSLTSS